MERGLPLVTQDLWLLSRASQGRGPANVRAQFLQRGAPSSLTHTHPFSTRPFLLDLKRDSGCVIAEVGRKRNILCLTHTHTIPKQDQSFLPTFSPRQRADSDERMQQLAAAPRGAHELPPPGKHRIRGDTCCKKSPLHRL